VVEVTWVVVQTSVLFYVGFYTPKEEHDGSGWQGHLETFAGTGSN
jgi:hypothetical protein